VSRKTLVVYLMAMPDTPGLAEAAVDAGADIIEIGFPFSDPLADGPLIRRAGEQALAAGMRTRRCLEVLAEIRTRVDVPLVPMTYASIYDAYGWKELERDARAAGATAFIVPDLPTDVRTELRRIQLVAPTSTDERVRLAAEATDGWLYLVTVTGTTGARADLAPTLVPLADRARASTDVPLYAGFGISTGEHARAAGEVVDGVVVGSAAVAAAENGPAALAKLVGELRTGLDA
jgi:tryptophan synthase alpha chain